jgi:translation elongation factor EF-Tu-like GTPase
MGKTMSNVGQRERATQNHVVEFFQKELKSDMDKDLEALQQRLHKTQQIKQGMMQELLMGKTRLEQPKG